MLTNGIESETGARLETATALDEADVLASFRERFVIRDPEQVYLLANSLGRLPKATAERITQAVNHEWAERLIRGWNEGWMDLPQQIGDKIGRLIGARAGEVLVADATSVNLFKLVLSALQARPNRRKIVTDDLNFPSDLYILQGAVQAAGDRHELVVAHSQDGIHGAEEALAAVIDEETALVTLSLTAYKSGYTYELAEMTRRAHAAGALVLWDISHAAGAVPIDLTGAEVDLAVGCTYKYLCGGPGAPAYLYVRRELQEQLRNPLSGWMGQNNPFTFGLEYESAPGLRRFMTGTPYVLSLAAIEPGIDLLLEAGMDQARAKIVRQTEYLVQLYETFLAPLGFTLKSPRRADDRGAHVAFGHPEAMRISESLKQEMNVIPDFRPPDNLRFAVAPLYTSYQELFEAVMRLRRVVVSRLYEAYPSAAPFVT